MEGLGLAKRNLVEKIITDVWKTSPQQKVFTYNELLYVIQELLDQEGTKYLQDTDGKRSGHFSVFRSFVELLLYRNMANYDSMVLITSAKGGGKSSAAIMMAKYHCKLLGITFNPERHIAYNNADVMNKIDTLNKFEPIICDEAVRFVSSEDWAKKSTKELKKRLAQVRTKHLLFILCFPLKIYKLEKNFLEAFTNYWIDLYGRGVGAVFVKDNNPVHDTWRLKDFLRLSAYTEFTPKSTIEKELKKHPNYWQRIIFPRPSDALYNQYLNVRELNVYDDANILSTVGKEDIHTALLILALRDIMLHDSTLTMNRILLHISNEYSIKLSKKVIQDRIEDSKQLVLKIRDKTIDFGMAEQENSL